MKIAVIGPGAIGCLFAGFLSRGGHEVWLVDHDPRRARVLARRGVVVSRPPEPPGGKPGLTFRALVHATAQAEEVGSADLVLVAVKSFATAAAAQVARRLLGPNTVVLTLQNGFGSMELLQQTLGAERVVGGVTSQGATLTGPGQVTHAGEGPTVIGEHRGPASERVVRLAEAFSQAGLPAEPTSDLPSARWAKLVVNAGLNPVGALARVNNGTLVTCEPLRRAMRAAVDEAAAVARAKGATLPAEDMGAYTEEVCRRTANNLNSMLQDLLRGRPTEVEAINGAVVEAGREVGLPTAVNESLLLLIKGVEQTHAVRAAR